MPQSTRPDLCYIPLATAGLSDSRNSALARCGTPLLVFADDDMDLDTGGLLALAAEIARAPDLGFAAGWRTGRKPASGRRAGRYALRKLTARRVCAPELMVRADAVRRAGVTFDTGFGIGAKHPVGEDYIFVCDMLDAGLRGDAFPIAPGTHQGQSTGGNWQDKHLLAARRAVIARCFGAAAPLVRLAYALRHRKSLGGWAAAWRFSVGA